MPFEIETYDDDRLIVVRGHGPGRVEDALAAIDQLVVELEAHSSYAILSDNLELQYEPPVSEVMRIAESLFRHRKLIHRRMAILAKPGVQFHLAQVFAALANLADIELDAFLERDNALQWLRAKSY